MDQELVWLFGNLSLGFWDGCLKIKKYLVVCNWINLE